MSHENVSDRKIAGASYLLSFQTEIQLLTHNAGIFINNLLEVSNKYQIENKTVTKEPPSLNEEDKKIIKDTLQVVRLGVFKSFVALQSLGVLREKKETLATLRGLRDKILGSYMIEQQVINDYVDKMNDILVSEIMQDLLKTSSQYLNEIYGEN